MKFRLHVPLPFYQRPLGFFLVILFAWSGFAYATQIAEPTRITRLLNPAWLQAWGVLLMAASLMVFVGMLKNNLPLEKFGLRAMSISLLTYAGWTAVVARFDATLIVSLLVTLVFFNELRVRVIRKLVKPWTNPEVKK